MKLSLYPWLLALAMFCSLSAFSQRPTAPHPALLIASYTNNAAYIVSEDGRIVWEYKMPGGCQDAWLLPSGHILLSGGRQVREVTADKKLVWEYQGAPDGQTEIHNCQPLPDGRTLVGEGGTCRLLELDAQGKIAKEIRLKLGGNAHTHMRQVRKTPAGTYLVAASGEANIYEFDQHGRQLRAVTGSEMKKQGVTWKMVHSVDLLPNGHWLIGGSYDAPLVEVDRENRVVWKLSAQDIPEIGFNYSAGCLRLANGNTVVAAYHSAYPIFEVTPGKKIVWKYRDPAISGPTHVKLLAPGDLKRFLEKKP